MVKASPVLGCKPSAAASQLPEKTVLSGNSQMSLFSTICPRSAAAILMLLCLGRSVRA